MYFWVNGKKTPVVVDDFIPTLNGKPFSVIQSEEGTENEIWAILLEKGWAKLHGSYQRTEAGLPSNALYALTGKPSWRHMHNLQSDLFKLIMRYNK